MKKFIAIALALVLTLGVCSFSLANADDPSLSKVQESGKLIVGLDASFPPMGYTDENGDIVGFDIDVAKEVCTRLGVELVLQPIAWASKNLELDSGNIDCIWNGFTITPERIEQCTFSVPYMANTQVIVVKADSAFQTLSDLAGKNLGVQAGSSAVDALDANKEFSDTVNVSEFSDNMVAMMDLSQGGLDCVLVDVIVAGYYFAQTGTADQFRVLDETLASEEYGIGFRKDDLSLCMAVDAALSEMDADGSLAEISTKWFNSDITTVKQYAGDAVESAEVPAT